MPETSTGSPKRYCRAIRTWEDRQPAHNQQPHTPHPEPHTFQHLQQTSTNHAHTAAAPSKIATRAFHTHVPTCPHPTPNVHLNPTPMPPHPYTPLPPTAKPPADLHPPPPHPHTPTHTLTYAHSTSCRPAPPPLPTHARRTYLLLRGALPQHTQGEGHVAVPVAAAIRGKNQRRPPLLQGPGGIQAKTQGRDHRGGHRRRGEIRLSGQQRLAKAILRGTGVGVGDAGSGESNTMLGCCWGTSRWGFAWWGRSIGGGGATCLIGGARGSSSGGAGRLGAGAGAGDGGRGAGGGGRGAGGGGRGAGGGGRRAGGGGRGAGGKTRTSTVSVPEMVS